MTKTFRPRLQPGRDAAAVLDVGAAAAGADDPDELDELELQAAQARRWR